MLKFFFACLLLANGALFAYQRGYLDTLISDGREPARTSRQLNVDKIKVISPGEAAAASAVSSASVSTDVASNAPVPTAELAVTEEKKPNLIACTEIGNFADTDAVKFEKQLASLTLGERVSRRKIEEVSSHIVAIPSQGSKEGADKKASELRRFGVTDFFIIKDEGNMQWGISLGVYKTQQAAQSRLVDLIKKGVHSARVAPYSTSSTKVAFQLHNLDMTTKDAVDKIKGGFPQQEIRSCI
jgi:hypothetical protein